MTPNEYLQRLQTAVLRAVKKGMQRAGDELSAYTLDYMQDPSKKEGLTKSKRTKGSLYYNVVNPTNRLRTLYGNLTRALIPGEQGNVNKVTIQGGTFVLGYGFDPDASVKAGPRTTTLFYGILHEQGNGGQKKRPFLEPGIKEYLKDNSGFKALVREMMTDVLDEVS